MMSIIVHSAEQVKPARALLVIWRHICPKAASSAPPLLPSLCARRCGGAWSTAELVGC